MTLSEDIYRSSPVYVIGANGRAGAALCRSLAEDGVPYVPVVRKAARWKAKGLPGDPVIADLRRKRSLRKALGSALRVACCAHARYVQPVLDATAQETRVVFLGSTRKYSRFPDAHGDGVKAGEDALNRSGAHGVMLHPTMIYGAEGEDNVQRLARLMRRLPLIPLPGGGKSLVQPIHHSDVTRCIRAALDRHWPLAESIVIAGPDPVPYYELIQAIARAADLPQPRIMPLSLRIMRALSPLTVLPGIPRIRKDELQRLTEDKAFSIAAMQRLLGVNPIPLAEGLALTFAPEGEH